MTNRYTSLTVVLDGEIRDEDAVSIINAIQMIKGVVSVSGNVSDTLHHVAKQQALNELRRQIDGILYPND